MIAGIGVLAIPVSVGFAILRHRLFDIDLVISRTLVFGLLAAFIAIVYVAVVVAIPAAVLGRGGEGFDMIPFVAAAVIALALSGVPQTQDPPATSQRPRKVFPKEQEPEDVLRFDTDLVSVDVTAVDVSPAMVATLRQRAAAEGLTNLVAVQAGFLTYEHAGPPVDGVFTRNALHHLPDFWKAVALDAGYSLAWAGIADALTVPRQAIFQKAGKTHVFAKNGVSTASTSSLLHLGQRWTRECSATCSVTSKTSPHLRQRYS